MSDDTNPRERRHKRTRAEILEAAIAIIREKGADKLSLREVARRSDYSPAGLYEYFANKDALADAICEESNLRLLNRMRAVPTDLPPTEYLVQLGRAYIDFARQNPEHFLFLFSNHEVEMPTFDIDTYRADFPDDPFLIAVEAAQRAINTGAIDPRGQDAITITYQFWAMMHGMAMLQVQYFKSFPVAFETADIEGIRTFVRGLGA